MKLLQLLFLLSPLGIFAQNWQLVVPGETYHYRLDNADFITHTIKVDSVQQINNQTVYFLNRILRKVSTGPSEFEYYKDMGQFLQQNLWTHSDGSIQLESISDFLGFVSIKLYPSANLGFTWDAENNTTANISSVELGEVLGQPDSLKTIHFSDGNEWVISKNHGLISCPDLVNGGTVRLSGLESLNLGDRLYRFEDFFDFELGSLFEYGEYYFGMYGSESKITKDLILEKTFSPDAAAYRVQRKWKRWNTFYPTGVTSTTFGVDTLWVNYNRSDYQFPYNNQFLPLDPCNCKGTFGKLSQEGQEIGAESSINLNDCSVLIEEDPSIPEKMICSGYSIFEQYRLGLGQTEYEKSVVDNNIRRVLLGAIVHGDTIWGDISPDWFLTSAPAPPPYDQSLSIFPNPASDLLYVMINDEGKTPATVKIFNSDSKLFQTEQLNDVSRRSPIDVSALPNGVYVLVMQSDERVWHSKFVKN